MFTAPTWFGGMLFYLAFFILPVIFGVITLTGLIKDNNKMFICGFILTVITLLLAFPVASVMWHQCYEIPSVQEKNITVGNWQPSPHVDMENGFMVIKSADDLMMVTTDGEGFYNEENLLFGKFDTRDILNELRPGGTYTIKYYGWREGFNTGFPNILEVTEIIDQTNTTPNDLNTYMGNRMTSGGI